MDIIENGFMFFSSSSDKNCVEQKKILNKIKEENGIDFKEVDIENDDITPRFFQVKALPTISLVSNGKEVFYKKGLAKEKVLQKALKKMC